MTSLSDVSEHQKLFADGLFNLLKPAIEELDASVLAVRHSQLELRQQIDSLTEDLKKINEQLQTKFDLEPYLKKLNNARRRIMLVNNIMQNVQERVNRLHSSVLKDVGRKNDLLGSAQLTRRP